mmetsp:Transcript_18345/g.35054  ORF Transcript_18345/g.35054 Transcript_18345/m.35054 type:complete len:448 (-) Transcript_18345:177-1520(-)
MNNNESPRTALTDRFFRLEAPQDGSGGSISPTKKDVFSKTSSCGNDASFLSSKRSSMAILIAPIPFHSPYQENWGLEANKKSPCQTPSTISSTSCSSAELYLPPLPIYDESIEAKKSKRIVSLDLYHFASIIQAATRRFLATKAALRLRITPVHSQSAEIHHKAAVKIQTVFRLWYCHTLFRMAVLQHRLEQTQKDTKKSLRLIAQKKHQEMVDYKQAMIMAAEQRFRRGERYISKMEKLSENLRAENELILEHSQELMADNETKLKCQIDLRDESMSLQSDLTSVLSKLEHLQRDKRALKISSKSLEKRIEEFQQVLYRVKAFSAFEAKVTAVTTDAIYKSLAIVRQSCTDDELASDIVVGGMKQLKLNAEYAKLRKETARHDKLRDAKNKHRKAGKHTKANITEIKKPEKEKRNESKKAPSSKSSIKVGKRVSNQKMHVRLVIDM